METSNTPTRFQYRFNLKDADPVVRNKVLIISKGYFTVSMQLFSERHFKRGNKDVIEMHLNGALTSYYETEPVKHFYVTKGYGADGGLFTIKKFEVEGSFEVRERVIVYDVDGGIFTN